MVGGASLCDSSRIYSRLLLSLCSYCRILFICSHFLTNLLSLTILKCLPPLNPLILEKLFSSTHSFVFYFGRFCLSARVRSSVLAEMRPSNRLSFRKRLPSFWKPSMAGILLPALCTTSFSLSGPSVSLSCSHDSSTVSSKLNTRQFSSGVDLDTSKGERGSAEVRVTD